MTLLLPQIRPADPEEQTWSAGRPRTPHESVLRGHGLRMLSALPVRAFLRTYHRLRIVGREHLPRDRTFVMVANHASHLDALCLLSAVPLSVLHRTFPVAAQDYFFGPMRRLRSAALLANAIPFNRGRHVRKSLNLCRQFMAVPGNILIFFPEGTRTTTGRLGAFRSGIGSLVAGTEVPVVPCAIEGTFGALPKGGWLPRPRTVRLVIGPPRQFADYSRSRVSSERIACELRDAVQELLCQ